MTVYCVAYHAANEAVDKVLGGLWGVFSSYDKARGAVEAYMEQYNELLLDAYEMPNGLYRYETSTGYYLIEAIEVDTVWG